MLINDNFVFELSLVMNRNWKIEKIRAGLVAMINYFNIYGLLVLKILRLSMG